MSSSSLAATTAAALGLVGVSSYLLYRRRQSCGDTTTPAPASARSLAAQVFHSLYYSASRMSQLLLSSSTQSSAPSTAPPTTGPPTMSAKPIPSANAKTKVVLGHPDAQIVVLHASSGGLTTNVWADSVADKLAQLTENDVVRGPISTLELEDLADAVLSGAVAKVVFCIATHTGGTAPDEATVFLEQVREAANDFRFGRAYLTRGEGVFGGEDEGVEKWIKKMRSFSVIGFGCIEWGRQWYCAPAKRLHAALGKLGGSSDLLCVDTGALEDRSIEGKLDAAIKNMLRDELSTQKKSSTREGAGGKSKDTTKPALSSPALNNNVDADAATASPASPASPCDTQECACASRGDHSPAAPNDSGCCKSSDSFAGAIAAESDHEEISDYSDSDSEATEDEVESDDDKKLVDDIETAGTMLTQRQRKNLTKEGYKVVGTHSAVKLCRWTKHHLRGRGGCYKHTFYGIASYSCMEATPSLACANKCVFCWRHHKNPVAKKWSWRMDPPQMIVDGWLTEHAKLIKQLKGVPGVSKERFEAASKIRHCALSLVGEPIMYPEINKVLELLHDQQISSFLVTNAQFPDQIKTLGPCTQLYTSIDAATKEELLRVDRPLNEDFYERFLASIDNLRGVQFSRSVFRLTLVKSFNMTETAEYAKLVRRGRPDFLEIKGVTYNGDQKQKDKMTMSHVPWHDEVVAFGNAILQHDNLDQEYELACEHRHSLCILIALKSKFKKPLLDEVTGKPVFEVDSSTGLLTNKPKLAWHTHIDYAKFHELVRSGKWRECDSSSYALPTPDWAVAGSKEQGFDPLETRHHRKKRKDADKIRAAQLAEEAEGGK